MKISRKLVKLIPSLKSRPKDIRMSSISDKMREHGVQRDSSIGINTSIRKQESVTFGKYKNLNR